MSSNKRVIRNSFIYTTSNILLKACSFLLIPIYTNYLTTDDYGIVSIINSFTSVAIYLIVFSLFSAVFRFYADIKNDHCKVKRYIGTICTFCLITNVFFLAICFCTQKIVSNTFFAGVDFFPIVLLALIYTSTNSLYTLYQDILKSMQFAKKSAVTSLLYFFVQLVICIYLVAILRLGAVGTITAYVVTQIVFCVWAFVDLNKMDVFQFCIDKELLKESLMYSIPIIPHNLSTTIAQYVSKLFISGSFSLSAVGVFNLAQQFGLIADTVQSSVSSAFQPWLFEQLNEKERTLKKNIFDLTKMLTWAYCFIFILIGFFSKEAIEIIASKSYLPAWEVVPLIVLTYAIKIPYYFYVTVLFYYKKATNKVFIITLSTSLLNIFLSALFIPELSMIGSVLADAISMGSRVALVIVFSKKFGDVGFRLWSIVSRIIYPMVIMGVFLLPSYLNGSIGTLFEILVKIVGVLVFMAGILVFERKNLGNVKVIMLSGIDKIFRKGERE